MKLRVNAPVDQATRLLERFAQIGHEIIVAEGQRDQAIAATNAVADAVLLPLLEEREALRAQLEPWWTRVGAALLPAKRKTMELGGCVIGTKAARPKLLFALGDDKVAAATLNGIAWAKKLLRHTPSLDKAAIATALEGKRGDELRVLGFSMSAPEPVFVLDPVTQAGTAAA
ncbi:host-nuclease inhibitor Gam family protein [Sphingomonas adhaesiva]|uniref:host-nuclease inhibitor Gam family protein n=1 Tax=Sphingomonas adhaesiva TaxID=28212 RepID=UPI002FFA4EF0